MRKLKVILISAFSIIALLTLSFIHVFATSNVTVKLQQQEDDLTNIRYICTISGVENESDLESYSVNIKVGTTSFEASREYYKFYRRISGLYDTVTEGTYYAIFTLTDINKSPYKGNRLITYFNVKVGGETYKTNYKYFEVGSKYAIEDVTYAGYTEGAYLEFDKPASIPSGLEYHLQYRKSTDEKFTDADSQLIRETSTGHLRGDVVGLAAGDYALRAYALVEGVKYTTEELEVTVGEDDRSGYAHFNNTTGVGAYTNDGTLKSGAIVVYVTDETKNTVTSTISGTTYTGLVNIIHGAATKGATLDVRILDTIKTNQWASKSCEPRLADNSNLQTDTFWVNTFETTYGDNLEGLCVTYMDKYEQKSYKYLTTASGISLSSTGSSSAKTTTYKGSEYSSLTGMTVYDDDSYWNMLDTSGAKNITIEGIGTDAGCFQWGFTWKSCNSIEVKNLTFTDYPEDACSFEGGTVNDTGNFWIHNNTFNKGKNNWDVSGERDKAEGDGSIDLKLLSGATASYNQFNGCHKTGLVGGGNSDLSMNITYHHNYYNACGSRLPLARQANMHMYNNYYYGSTSYSTSLRSNAYAFIENCYYEGGKNPYQIYDSSATVKNYNNTYDNVTVSSGYGSGNNVTSRTASVSNSSNCKPDGSTSYQDFDTNSTLFYYDSANQCSDVEIMTATADVPTVVVKYAGAGKCLSLAPLRGEEEETPVTPATAYSVTYNANGGTGTVSDTNTYNAGDTITVKTNAYSKSGYTFNGWNTKSDGSGTSYNAGATFTISGDVTLYAQWKSSSNATSITTITFNDFTATSELTTNTTVGNVTLTAGTSSKKVKVLEGSYTAGTVSVTKYVSFAGGGSYTSQSAQFTTTGKANITIYYSAASAGRYAALITSDGTSTKASNATTADNAIISSTISDVTAGSYAVISSGSGLYIYAIVIEYV